MQKTSQLTQWGSQISEDINLYIKKWTDSPYKVFIVKEKGENAKGITVVLSEKDACKIAKEILAFFDE